MPNFVVVGTTADHPGGLLEKYANGYKGVQRHYLDYPVDYYEQDHVINTLFARYSNQEGPYINDLEFAIQLRDVYNSAYPSVRREILELVPEGKKPEAGIAFLGYDIVDDNQSNILKVVLPYAKDFEDLMKKDNLDAVLTVIAKGFYSFLNEHELFTDYQIATAAEEIIEGTLAIFGRKYRHHHYSVMKIYLV